MKFFIFSSDFIEVSRATILSLFIFIAYFYSIYLKNHRINQNRFHFQCNLANTEHIVEIAIVIFHLKVCARHACAHITQFQRSFRQQKVYDSNILTYSH